MKVRVYFAESDRSFWMKWFLKAGFSHCFIVVVIDGQDILINPSSHYTYIGQSDGIYEGTYIDVNVHEPVKRPRTIWEVNSCVTQIKNFLGIQKYGIFTPFQLHRHLTDGITL